MGFLSAAYQPRPGSVLDVDQGAKPQAHQPQAEHARRADDPNGHEELDDHEAVQGGRRFPQREASPMVCCGCLNCSAGARCPISPWRVRRWRSGVSL